MDRTELLANCEATELEILARAQSEVHRAQSEFDERRQLFDDTQLPTQYWPRQARALLEFFQKQHSQACRDFQRALKAVRSQQPKQTITAKSKPEPKPEPPPQKSHTKIRLYQTSKIEVVDGEVITTVDLDAAFWLASNFRRDADEICR